MAGKLLGKFLGIAGTLPRNLPGNVLGNVPGMPRNLPDKLSGNEPVERIFATRSQTPLCLPAKRMGTGSAGMPCLYPFF